MDEQVTGPVLGPSTRPDEPDAEVLLDVAVQRLFAVGLTLQSLLIPLRAGDRQQRLTAAVEDIDHAIRQIRGQLQHD